MGEWISISLFWHVSNFAAFDKEIECSSFESGTCKAKRLENFGQVANFLLDTD